MIIKYSIHWILMLASFVGVRADVLVDFGRTDNQTTGQPAGYNNLAIGTAAGAAVNCTTAWLPIHIASNGGGYSNTNVALTDTAGGASGWTISFQARTQQASAAGQVGTAGTGGDYTGTVGAVATGLFAATATRDGLYVNNSGMLRVVLGGLTPAKRYDLSAFAGRDGSGTADGGRWSLAQGSATTAHVLLNGSATATANTGQIIDSYGANEGDMIQWLGVAPDAGGQIVIEIATQNVTGNAVASINALKIAEVAAPAGGECDVYLLGGQSNMMGLGKTNELSPAQLTPPANVYYWNGSAIVAMVPGSTPTAGAGEFGPELGFATEIARRGRKACIVKYANSGKPLDAGWNDQSFLGDPPAPGRVNFYPGESAADPNQGTLYKHALLPTIQAALQAIITQGDTPVIRGLIWMQGEQDSKNALSAGRYAENLKRLRDRLAADLGLASPVALPVAFGQVLGHEPAAARFTHRVEIRADMALADQDSGSAKAIPLCRMVPTDTYPVYPEPDTVHFTTPGQLALGKAFAGALAGLTAMPIHVAFHNQTATRDAMAAGVAPLAQGTVVDTSTSQWNNLTNTGAHAFANVPIVSADGSSRGAGISGTTGYTGSNANGWQTGTKDTVMMDGWYGIGGSENIAVANLPGDLAQRYHVVIHGDSNDTNRTMNYSIGGTTMTIQDSGTFTGTFADGANRVVFTGLSGSAFTLTGNAAGSPRSAVNGISIVPGDPFAITSFSANDYYVDAGQNVTLQWAATGADTITLNPGPGTVTGNSTSVVINTTTTFTLTATKGGQSLTQSITVFVGPPRPNIVVFMVDDMGWQDTSVPFQHDANGNPVVTGFNQRYRTPNMAALATSGMKFTSAYACSVCSPSRVSLMTGMSAARHGVTQWTLTPNTDESGMSATLKSPLDWNVNGLAPASDTTTRTWRTGTALPQLLKDAGYRTIHVGKAHFGADGLPGEDPKALGFDVNIAGHAAGGPSSFLGTDNFAGPDTRFNVPGLEAYHGTNTFLTEALTLEGNKAVDQAVTDGMPFYLYMSHYAVHVPLAEDTRFSANYPGVDATERKYATMLEGMDKSLGDIRAKLQQLGVADNTLILFYSDNGGLTYAARGTTPDGTGANTHNKPLRAGKGSAYEGGVRVPAIAAWAAANPANPFQAQLPIAAGSRCDKPVIIEDLFPTVLDVAGVAKPAGIDGVGFTGYLKNDPAFQRPVSLLFHYPHVWIQSLLNQNQGYEMYSSLREGDWKIIHYYQNSRWELYNIADDPVEASNLAAARPDLVLPLGRKMIRLLEERGADYPANRSTGLAQPPLLPANTTVDTDKDGQADGNEDPNRNGLVDPGETSPDKADSDGDGTPDGVELRLGTDPLNPDSAFRATPTRPPGAPDSLRLTWPSLPGSLFTIHASPDLSDWADIVAEHLPAAAEPARTTSFDIFPLSADRRFFRITLE